MVFLFVCFISVAVGNVSFSITQSAVHPRPFANERENRLNHQTNVISASKLQIRKQRHPLRDRV